MLQGIGEIRNCLSTTQSHGKFKQIFSIIFLTHNEIYEIFRFHLCIKYKLNCCFILIGHNHLL